MKKLLNLKNFEFKTIIINIRKKHKNKGEIYIKLFKKVCILRRVLFIIFLIKYEVHLRSRLLYIYKHYKKKKRKNLLKELKKCFKKCTKIWLQIWYDIYKIREQQLYDNLKLSKDLHFKKRYLNLLNKRNMWLKKNKDINKIRKERAKWLSIQKKENRLKESIKIEIKDKKQIWKTKIYYERDIMYIMFLLKRGLRKLKKREYMKLKKFFLFLLKKKEIQLRKKYNELYLKFKYYNFWKFLKFNFNDLKLGLQIKKREEKRNGKRINYDFDWKNAINYIKNKMKQAKVVKKFYPIKLVIEQLVELGLHLGHDKKISLFLNGWVIYGYRSNQAILRMRKSLWSFLQLHFVVKVGIKLRRAFWFVCFDEDYMGYTVRYALLTGQALYINNWMFGSLSNFKHINRRGLFLKYISKFYNLKKKEKKFISRFSGILRTKRKVPFGVFIMRLNEMGVKVSAECGAAKVVSTSLVDSDSYGEGVMIPVPGNDDSLICVLFFMRFLANLIFAGKMKYMKKWKKNILRYERNQELYKENFLNYVIKKKKMDYKKYLLEYSNYYFFSDQISSFKSIENINLSGMKPDIQFIYLDTILPKQDETKQMLIYTL